MCFVFCFCYLGSPPSLCVCVDVGSGTEAKANMAHDEGEEMDHILDENDMAEVDDIMYFRGRVIGDSESDEEDDDEYDHLVCFHPLANSYHSCIYIDKN